MNSVIYPSPFSILCSAFHQASVSVLFPVQDEIEEDQERAIEYALMKPLILAKNINAVYPFAFEAFEEIGTDYTMPDLAGMNMSAPWVKAVEKGLESIIWRLFHRQRGTAENHLMFVADGPAAGLKAEKVVLMGAPQGTDLMFAGNVTTDPGVNSLKIVEISGITFYINPVPTPPSGEVLFPAWLAKPTPKKDFITVKSWSSQVSIYIDESGTVSTTDPQLGYDTSLELYRVQIAAGKHIGALRDQLNLRDKTVCDTLKENECLNKRLTEVTSQLELLQAGPSLADKAEQTEPQDAEKDSKADPPTPPPASPEPTLPDNDPSLQPTLIGTQIEEGALLASKTVPADGEPADGKRVASDDADASKDKEEDDKKKASEEAEAAAAAETKAADMAKEVQEGNKTPPAPEPEKEAAADDDPKNKEKRPETVALPQSEVNTAAVEEVQQTGTTSGTALDEEAHASHHSGSVQENAEQEEPKSPAHKSDLEELFQHGEMESDYEMPDSLEAAIEGWRAIRASKNIFLANSPKFLKADMTLHMFLGFWLGKV